MTDSTDNNGRRTWFVPGVSIAVAVALCTLAVQATWNMANGLSALRIDTKDQISDLKLTIQAIRMTVEEQGRQLTDLKSTIQQKSQPQGR